MFGLTFGRKSRSAVRLVDGSMRFVVPGSDAPWEADCVELKLVAEELERRMGLKRTGGAVQPSPEFLERLSGQYSHMAATKITSTMAHQVWMAVSERFSEIEAKFQDSMKSALR